MRLIGKYVLAHVPQWAITAAAAYALHPWIAAPPWLVAGAVVLLMLVDLAAYPKMRRYYEPEPAERRMVGLRGEATTPLTPSGSVRVRGELWRATAVREPIETGAPVRVVDIHGLEIVVERVGTDEDAIAAKGRA